ncbi:MAG: protein kinase [Hormoscilla sp.]
MEIYCTRPGCPDPINSVPSLDENTLSNSTIQQRYCSACTMPLILKGRYLPLRELGAGGFGATFLGQDLDTPRRRNCVIKRLQPQDNLDDNLLEKVKRSFRREAEVLENLGEENRQIPRLYAYFSMQVADPGSNHQQEFFYLVQEYVEGKNLAEELEQKGRFSEDEVLEVLQQMLPVLKFIHENGAIHRDIKPGNIMRSNQGRLYLIDFGAVKQVTTGKDTKESSIVFGTQLFVPLEQINGGQVYPSTDLYSLAVTCLCLLTNIELLRSMRDSFTNQWDWRPHARVSDHLAAILNQMLLPKPQERFQSAEEVIAALASSPKDILNNNLPKTQTKPIAVTRPIGALSTDNPLTNSYRQKFDTIELLIRGAFTGFEGSLLAIGLASLLGTTLISTGIWLLILAGLIFAQTRRLIKRSALPIIAVITLMFVMFVPALQTVIASGAPILIILLLASLAGVLGFALMALSQLIYNFLSSRI